MIGSKASNPVTDFPPFARDFAQLWGLLMDIILSWRGGKHRKPECSSKATKLQWQGAWALRLSCSLSSTTTPFPPPHEALVSFTWASRRKQDSFWHVCHWDPASEHPVSSASSLTWRLRVRCFPKPSPDIIYLPRKPGANGYSAAPRMELFQKLPALSHCLRSLWATGGRKDDREKPVAFLMKKYPKLWGQLLTGMTVNKGGIVETYAPSSWLCGGEADQVPGYTIYPLLSLRKLTDWGCNGDWQEWRSSHLQSAKDPKDPLWREGPQLRGREKGVGDKRRRNAGFSPGKLVSI